MKKIELIESTGFYAPLTSTGNIIVNNILASCHSSVKCPARLQQLFFIWHNRLQQFVKYFQSTFAIDYSSQNDNRIELSSIASYLLTILKLILPAEILSY